MRFSVRLTLFFTVTLLAIQGATIAGIQARLRETLLEDGKGQVAAAETRFVRQLSAMGDELAESVRLLTLDFALRQSIADHDSATVLSALRNHGHRVGANRMLLISPSGAIDGDTASNPPAEQARFPDPPLLDRAAENERAGRIAILDGKPVWLVVVSVMAPDLIAFVAAALPLDDARLTRIRDIAGVPGQIGIVSFANGEWEARAGKIDPAVLRRLTNSDEPLTVASSSGDETIVITHALATAPGAAAVRVVLDYPLSDALRRYRRVLYLLFPILSVGLIATLAGVMAISRGVARPIEALARQTRRIADGDYATPPRLARTLGRTLRRTDEIGELSVALGHMSRAIAEREQRVQYQATHDPVTGLANRQAVAAAIDDLAGSGAVLVFGLIRWREITSTVGHDVGDRLLRETAARITARLARGPEMKIIGGVGESSFAVLLEGADQTETATAAARVIGAFEQPYQEGELTIDAPVAVGIALVPAHGTEAAQLLRRAEVALASAMTAETRCAVYRPETDPHRPERLSLMSDLRAGLPAGEFQLLYQPRLDLRLGRITGAEALVRWNHPSRGLMMPDDFIALAEETGNVQHLTRWALRAGLTDAKYWRDQGVPARISINLSVRDLTDDALPIRLAGLLLELQMPPRSLVLEITESAIMGEPDAAIRVLRRLEGMGIDLAIDDFGVGQSSLAYLRRLPVRELKLDKAFVLRLAESSDDRAIVRSVTELGHGLGYHVTAEGVESAATLDLLREYGVDHAQGYHVGKPMTSRAMMGFVTSTRVQWTANVTEALP